MQALGFHCSTKSWRLLLLIFAAACSFTPAATRAEPGDGVSAALRSVFSPRRSPPQRTMGLAQRTFLDLVEDQRPKLQVAFVVDGTESMGPALEGVRDAVSQMLRDLDLYERTEISYQLVVYRDSGAESGEVAFPLNTPGNAFTSDRSALIDAVANLSAETGAPYFPELIDEGVHQALTKLPWTQDDETSRWVLLFGDAPPYGATVDEQPTGARQRFAADALVSLAAANQVRINCILCSTREEDQSAYETVLDQTRAFMSALSTGSGGLMLDLSYDDIRRAVVDAASGGEVEYARVAPIRRADVRLERARLMEPASPSDVPVRLAVLPHAPLESMTFATDTAATQLATELRLRMKSIPGINVSEPLIVERGYKRLERNPSYSGLRGGAMLQALGRMLGADYLLWGEVRDTGDRRAVQTRIYDTASGEIVAQVRRESGSGVAADQLGALVAVDVLSAAVAAAEHPALSAPLLAARDDATARGVVTRQISNSAAHTALVSGLASLEKALAYEAGDPEGGRLLVEAQERLSQAVDADDTNAFARFLLAACHFNLARQSDSIGGDAAEAMSSFGRQLRSAYRYRTSLVDSQLRTEIEADYALLVRKRPAEAIPLYQSLANTTATGDSARRANWMLAGVYGGDWGVGEEFVDQHKAREHLVRLLAQWPESSEARFIRRVLRWDEESGETRFQHFPRENSALATQVESDA